MSAAVTVTRVITAVRMPKGAEIGI